MTTLVIVFSSEAPEPVYPRLYVSRRRACGEVPALMTDFSALSPCFNHALWRDLSISLTVQQHDSDLGQRCRCRRGVCHLTVSMLNHEQKPGAAAGFTDHQPGYDCGSTIHLLVAIRPALMTSFWSLCSIHAADGSGNCHLSSSE